MSRNYNKGAGGVVMPVTPREGRVSRNYGDMATSMGISVTPREGRVSRNNDCPDQGTLDLSRPARGV